MGRIMYFREKNAVFFPRTSDKPSFFPMTLLFRDDRKKGQTEPGIKIDVSLGAAAWKSFFG
jgi:hypothetical protein